MLRLVSGESVHFVSSSDVKKYGKKRCQMEKNTFLLVCSKKLQQLSLKVCERLLHIVVNILYDIGLTWPMFSIILSLSWRWKVNLGTLTQLIFFCHFPEKHFKMQTCLFLWFFSFVEIASYADRQIRQAGHVINLFWRFHQRNWHLRTDTQNSTVCTLL